MYGFPSRKGDPSNPSNGRERVPRQRVNPSRTRLVLTLARGPGQAGLYPPVPDDRIPNTISDLAPTTSLPPQGAPHCHQHTPLPRLAGTALQRIYMYFHFHQQQHRICFTFAFYLALLLDCAPEPPSIFPLMGTRQFMTILESHDFSDAPRVVATGTYSYMFFKLEKMAGLGQGNLSFSSAVSGRPPSTPGELGDGSGNTSPGLARSEPDITSNVPPLSGTWISALIAPDEEIDEGWTPVTRRTARTHSPRPSTLNQAEANMSSEELMRMAECHRFYVDRAIAAARCKASSGPPEKVKPTFLGSPVSPAVPSGEGSSENKGKGLDPRNFGAVPSLIDFTEDDLAAQREALANFEEINHIIKQESVTPKRGLFDDAPLLDLSGSTSPYEEIPHPLYP
ncbi:hypothetical protein B0H14DRAFT_3462692 [Mycena olivaceomarginata]|nr:hypothetical protein B0H14DRAFT_3462692 [Mycena olivaceomarginata]